MFFTHSVKVVDFQSKFDPSMDKMLELYKAVAERETGFWTDLPVATGQLVSRDEWLSLMEYDPHHFQIATLTREDLACDLLVDGDIVERAVLVSWIDETFQ
jgi:hypothetical protein